MTKKKKFIFIPLNDHVQWGGSEELWSQVSKELVKENEVFAIVKKWKNEVKNISDLKEKGIKVYYKKIIPKGSFFSRIRRKFSNKDLHSISKLQELPEMDLAVISVGNHADMQLSNYCDYLSKESLPYVIIVQLATDLRNLNDSLIENLKYAYLNAQKIYFLSEENKLKTEMQLAICLENYEFVNNPFKYDQELTAYNKKLENKFPVALVAAFTPFHKGHDLLISVLGQDKWRNREFYLNIYGKGNSKKYLHDLIIKWNLKDKVLIHDYEEKNEEIWKENIGCILPSRMEGQSLTMLEAMSHGRMILATQVGDAERLIKDGYNGFLIPAATYNSIDSTLEKAWMKREEWLKMGLNSRKHLYNTVTLDPVKDFTAKLIKEASL